MKDKLSIERPDELYEKVVELCRYLGGELEKGQIYLSCKVNTDRGKVDILFYPKLDGRFGVKYLITKPDGNTIESSIEYAERFHVFEDRFGGYSNVKTLVAIGVDDSRNELEIYYKDNKVEKLKVRGVGYYKAYKDQKSKELLNMYNIEI